MQNLFVNPEDEFVVYVSVATNKDGAIFCDLNEESLRSSLEGFADVKECEIKTYKIVFKKPSFGDTVSLYDEIFSVNNDSVSFNPLQARYKKIAALIKSWDFDGEDKKPTESQIQKLHPVVANAIGIQVDFETGGVLS